MPSALELIDRFCLQAVDEWKNMGLSAEGEVLLLARSDLPGASGQQEAERILECFEQEKAVYAVRSTDAEEAEALEAPDGPALLDGADGILVPGGFGDRGTRGMMKAAQVARERGIPYFGICYGFQWATVEYARNVCGIDGADSTEVDENAPHKVIYKLRDLLDVNDLGGTMRHGRYACELAPGSLARRIYEQAGRLLDTTNCCVALHDEATGMLSFPLRVEGRQPLPALSPRPLGNGLIEHVLRTRVPQLLNGDVREMAKGLGLDVVGRPSTSWLGVPLLVGAAAAQPREPRPATPPDRKPVVVDADRMEHFGRESLIVFTGNVVARQDNAVQHAARMEVYLDEKSERIVRTVSTGGVRIVTRDCRTGTAQRAEYFDLEQRVVLVGNARVWQDENIVSGESITLLLAQDRSIVQGGQRERVKAVFYPRGEGERAERAPCLN